jgi:DNA damage-inducible protein 1
MTICDLTEFSKAVLGMEEECVLMKDGSLLASTSSLLDAGVVHGDLLVVMQQQQQQQPPQQQQASAATPAGLDFSNLLTTSMNNGGNNNNININNNPIPMYFAGMSLTDAVEGNPHPLAIVKLLQEHSHLFKELNYHNPILARKIKDQPYDKAVQIWRDDRVKGSIETANAISLQFHKEQTFTRRLKDNPDDVDAKGYFDRKQKQQSIQHQYQQAMQEYPESMGRVLMLYIAAKINDHHLQAFVDSGAQTTIMSKLCAQKCGILDLVDTRFAGVAVGVGTGKILGRIHIVQLQIGNAHFPCSVTVMDDMTLGGGAASASGKEDDGAPKPKDMDFLLGLDMLKRHTCSIDLDQHNLKFRLAPGEYLETPFLHEKDLDESKGGTKGFNAEKANEELMEAQRKYEEKGGGKDEDMEE